jgi:hypothetical protein
MLGWVRKVVPLDQRPSRSPVTGFAVVLSAFLVVGVAAGALWERLWTPPEGAVREGTWVLGSAGVAEAFAATGIYILVAAVAGSVTAAVAAWWFSGSELSVLVAVVVGASLAAWVMAATGHALGPPDPQVVAAAEHEATGVPADLRVGAVGAYAVFPASAVTACLAVWWGLRPRGEAPG